MSFKNTMFRNAPKIARKPNGTKRIMSSDTTPHGGDMLSNTEHGIWLSQRPVPCGINTVLGDAKNCRNLPDSKSKKPAITRASGVFLPLSTGLCQTRGHSHSIVAGGLLLTSYVTRLMPRTSLMIRPETRFNSA